MLFGTNVKSPKLSEPVTIFVDRSMGTVVLYEALAKAPKDQVADVVVHDEVFPQDADDEVWLEHCGRNGWIALTKDKLKESPTEREMVKNASVVVFRVSAKDVSSAQLAELVSDTLPLILRTIRRYRPPILATITKNKTVRVNMAEGESFPKPKEIKL